MVYNCSDIDKILCNKLKDNVDLSDDEFISQCLEE